MSHDSKGGSDMGAAMWGLVGGAVFIGVILYAIVLLTNNHFNSEAAEKPTGSVSAAVVSVVV